MQVEDAQNNERVKNWLAMIGMTEWMADAPINRFMPVVEQVKVMPPSRANNVVAFTGNHPAKGCNTLDQLHSALLAFTGCDVHKTAKNLVFAQGNPSASLMIVGEMPEIADDERGVPFSGDGGELLDKMLSAIKLSREIAYLVPFMPWRTPKGRMPTEAEIAACLPFLERHIFLVQPKVLLFFGGMGVKFLLREQEGMLKVRGKKVPYTTPDGLVIPTVTTFHPSYLLKSPAQKREAWQDLLLVQSLLQEASGA